MIYSGTKSLDAEIHIDFSKNTVTFDYSSNSDFSPYDSNGSESEKDNEWLRLPLYKQIPIGSAHEGLVAIPYAIADFWIQKIVTFLQQRNIFPEQWHYAYQIHMKETIEWFNGYYIDRFDGEMAGTILQVPIALNIYIEYRLEGEYKEQINKIHFERRIRRFIKYGLYPVDEQCGWILTFVFKSPPKHGSLEVRST